MSNNNKEKWKMIVLLTLSELLVMSVWFSASAVVPLLAEEWRLTASGKSWLTMSVQIGFVVGALVFSIFSLADRLSAIRLFSICSLIAATTTACIPIYVDGIFPAVGLRILTGLNLAGVYPVGMKIMASWTRKDRGLGIGLLVGALTIGSAMPHLIHFLGKISNWKAVMLAAAVLAALGGLIPAFFVSEGPHATPSPRFDWRDVGRIFRQREVVLANLGYLGHMWELYAMWTWVPIFLLTSFQVSGTDTTWAGLVSFFVIAIGGIGCVLAGWLADRWGRTRITIYSMAISGSCALLIGTLFGSNPALLATVCMIWGLAVVADSAQFSAAISELSRQEYMGTSLTLQTSMGFLLTMFTIRMIPTIQELVDWQYTFAFLAIGPIFGITAMSKLAKSPKSVLLAQGRG